MHVGLRSCGGIRLVRVDVSNNVATVVAVMMVFIIGCSASTLLRADPYPIIYRR